MISELANGQSVKCKQNVRLNNYVEGKRRKPWFETMFFVIAELIKLVLRKILNEQNKHGIKMKFLKLTLSVVMLFVLTTINLAQQTSKLYVVKNSAKVAEGEFISRSVRDVNGQVCAGLIIKTDLTGLKFQSNNGIVKSKSMPGQYFLYLSPTERAVDVFKFGYVPLKIILSEYDIYLKSERVWEIKVTGDKKPDLIPITIDKNIPDAVIYIDGKNKGSSNTQQVSFGKHFVRIVKYGYRTIADTIEVTKEKVLFPYKLTPISPVSYSIKTIPTGARVFLNNAEKGVSDYGDWEMPGKYSLRIIKSGYVDYNAKIELKDNAKNNFSFKLTKNTSFLRLKVNPPDAEVKLNNIIYKEKNIELQPGKYNIEILKAGFLPVSDTITLAIGDTLQKSYSLTKNVAYLKLNVTPSDAKVLLNKKDYSQRNSVEISPGTYFLEISKPGYYPVTETITLTLGKTFSKNYNLVQKVGGLRVASSPIDVKFTLEKNGSAIDSWNGIREIKNLPIGSYLLIAKADGYRTKRLNINIEENKTATRKVVLEKGFDFVSVNFNLGEKYDVSVDGKKIGEASSSSLQLPTGKHSLTLSNKERTVTKEVNIDENISLIKLSSESNSFTYLQSLVIPGLGQITSGRAGFGIVLFTAFTGVSVWHYLNFKNYYAKRYDFNTSIEKFNNSNDPEQKAELAKKISSLNSEVNNDYDVAQKSMFVVIGVYVINVLDVLIATPVRKDIVLSKQNNMSLVPWLAPNAFCGVNFGVTIRF